MPRYPSHTATLTAGGTPLPFTRFSARVSRGEPWQWSASIDNSSGDYGPESSLLDCTTYNGLFQVQRSFAFNLTLGGQPWTAAPRLLQTDHQPVGDALSTLAAIEGSDYSEMLLTPDQKMSDVESSQAGGLKMAKATLAEILTAFGIASYDLSDFEDYPINILHRVGSPLDWIREILEVRQAWWYFRGGTFVVKSGGGWSAGSAAWQFTDRLNIKMLSFRRSLANVYNSAVCERVDASQGIALEKNDEGRGFVGPLELDFPVGSAQVQIWLEAGSAENVTWYDADDNILVVGPVYTGATGATKVRFTLVPPSNESLADAMAGRLYRYELTVRGQRPNGLAGSGFSANYHAEYTDAADVAVHGLRPWPQPLVLPIILHQSDAQDFIQRWVRESVRTYVTAQIETVLNPFVELGQTVAITMRNLGLVGYRMMVESIELIYDPESAQAVMRLELSRPAAGG